MSEDEEIPLSARHNQLEKITSQGSTITIRQKDTVVLIDLVQVFNRDS